MRAARFPYKRGNIIDRNGTYLAISEKVYNLVVDPKQILDTEENYQYLDATLDALVECFGYKRDELQAMIEEKKGQPVCDLCETASSGRQREV